jgi:TolB protein
MDIESNLTLLLTIDASPQNASFTVVDNRYPAWSPDGTRIAYHSNLYGNWDLFVMDADGSNVRRLTDHSADDAMPSWSPDGTRLVFHSARSGNWDVWMVDVNTLELRQLTFYPGEDTFPTWSPDGNQIAYASDRDGDLEIYVRSAVDPALGGPDSTHYTLRLLTDNIFDDWSPAWSPDSQYISFVADENGSYAIRVMNADDGSNVRTLSAGPVAINNEWNPTWLRDGNGGYDLGFVSAISGIDQIYTIDLVDLSRGFTEANRVITGELNSWAPDWRPMP